MQPILDLITEQQATISAAADALREQITKLTDELRLAETDLADLATTQTTLTRLASTTTSDETSTTSTVYQQIIAAFHASTDTMRAKDVCQALGIGTEPKDTEGVRAKLKRLVKRQVLTEPEPGQFALAAPTEPSDKPVTDSPNSDTNPIWT